MKTINKIALFLIFVLSFILSLPIIIGDLITKEDAEEMAFFFWLFLCAVVIVVGTAILFMHYELAAKFLNLYHELVSKLTWT